MDQAIYGNRDKLRSCVSQQEFIKLKQKLRKLEEKIEILQKVNCTVSSPLQEKLQELAKLYGQHSVHALCEVLCVSRGTFYNHISGGKRITPMINAEPK